MEFKSCSLPSIGMEWELQLLNPHTFELVDGILPLLANCSTDPSIKPEYSQCMVEINSRPCENIQELTADITAILTTLQEKCRELGMAVCGGGTHPFNHRFTNVTPLPRYLVQGRGAGYLGDLSITFALHIHVGMPSGDAAITVMDKLQPYLPILLALAASSPFWWGNNTGYASFRQRFLAIDRTFGLPPDFKNWQDFAHFFRSARSAGTIDTLRDLHWDIRPHPDFGTLELRVMDSQPTIQEALALVALVRSLMVYLHRCGEGNQGASRLSRLPWSFEKENYFRASHQGLDASYIIDPEGHTRPFTAIAREMFAALTPTATELGAAEYLEFLTRRLTTGGSYARQRRVFTETRDLTAVVAALVAELQKRERE
jgi:glutamate---cysteine ligase / carboxylate-amine ligase